MPTIDIINGIKINIYNGDHRPPHIHAVYNEFDVLIVIENGRIIRGRLPAPQLREVLDWLAENSEWALAVFYELNPPLK